MKNYSGMSAILVLAFVLMMLIQMTASASSVVNEAKASEPAGSNTSSCTSAGNKKIPSKPKSAVIPLSEIWALDMPGTRDVRKLDPRKDVNDTTAISKIGRVLTIRTAERKRAGPCFLVTGEGIEALQNASKVLGDGAAPEDPIPADEDVSLVFFSCSAPGYVHIHSVQYSGKHVTVRFQVVIHQSSAATVHFALIPLDKLPAGKVTVKVVEIASKTPYSNHALTDRAVCDSCTFTIINEVQP
jgi:hypothetical protein